MVAARYVRALGIDPVKDAEMIWIAEEAYNAPLPPNWEEHFDADGRSSARELARAICDSS